MIQLKLFYYLKSSQSTFSLKKKSNDFVGMLIRDRLRRSNTCWLLYKYVQNHTKKAIIWRRVDKTFSKTFFLKKKKRKVI